MTYSDKLKDPRWQRKRLQILERDEFTCRDCGSTNKTLHVHHCYYDKRDPWDSRDDVLLTLCAECHDARGDLEADAKLFFGQIMARLPHQPEIQEDLQNFVNSLHGESSMPDGEFSPLLTNHRDWQEMTQDRWFRYAVTHPEVRQAFEVITGWSPRWGNFENAEFEKLLPAG